MMAARKRGKGPRKSWTHLLVGLLVLASPEVHAQPAKVGVATNAIGVLLVTRSDGTKERLQGKGALPLYEADELQTEAGAQALIELNDGTRIALNEQTTFVLRSRRPREGGLSVSSNSSSGRPGSRPLPVRIPWKLRRRCPALPSKEPSSI